MKKKEEKCLNMIQCERGNQTLFQKFTRKKEVSILSTILTFMCFVIWNYISFKQFTDKYVCMYNL